MSSAFEAPHVIVALDNLTASQVDQLLECFTPRDCRLKVGKELFVRSGPAYVKKLVERGFAIFLDLKFHDIPNTVAQACRAAADLGVWMINVHACGGTRMLEAARESIAMFSSRPLLIGVTVLTSMENTDLIAIGIKDTLEQHAERLALLTQQAGLDGVVCSAQEAQSLRQRFGEKFCLVTPGIRFDIANHNHETDDQRRIVTPQQAFANGVDYIVVGRPITQAADPREMLKRIAQDFSYEKGADTRPAPTSLK